MNTPKYSIIIPTYFRPEKLEKCLGAIQAMDYPHDQFEVVVVDDSGEGDAKWVLERKAFNFPVHVIIQKHQGPAQARNEGAQTSRGKYLAFMDDDCRPAGDWLKLLDNFFEDHANVAVGGRMINGFPKNIYSEGSQMLIDYLYAYFNSGADNTKFLISSNLVIAKDKFDLAGGFNPVFKRAAGEDRNFCKRLLKNGIQLKFIESIRIYHDHPLGFWSFFRQHFNYGMGANLFRRVNQSELGEKVNIEPILFYTNLIKFPFSQRKSGRALVLSVLLVFSQFANALGFFIAKLNRRQLLKVESA